jgi:hypothetical protein
MTNESGDERLAELVREHERQNQQWTRMNEAIAALGDVTLAIPNEILERVEDACMVHASTVTSNLSIRA